MFASRDHGVIVNSGSTVARRVMAEVRILIRLSVFPHYLGADWALSTEAVRKPVICLISSPPRKLGSSTSN